MSKPYIGHCKKYCKDYPCNREHCGRERGFKGNGAIEMLDTITVTKFNYYFRKELYNEPRVTITNGGYFKRKQMR